MHERILLCDDEIHVVRALGLRLTQAGFQVLTAHDGEAAWDLLCRRPPDLLITDCQMPRLDGLALCRRIRACEHLRRLPVVLLTGKGFELDPDELRDVLQIAEVVAKPFSPRRLVHLAHSILQRAPHAAADCFNDDAVAAVSVRNQTIDNSNW